MSELRQQWERERQVWPEGPDFDNYARQVARSPWIFGNGGRPRGRRRELVEEARRYVRALDGPAPSRFRDSGERSPSGCTLVECPGCLVRAKVPTCRRQGEGKCSDEAVAWGAGWAL